VATAVAMAVVGVELILIAWIRHRSMDTPLLTASLQVISSGSPSRPPPLRGLSAGKLNALVNPRRRGRRAFAMVRIRGGRTATDPLS